MTLANQRANTNVLVVESQAMGMIGVIRSLGMAGYCVHAVAEHADALGLHSKYATHSQTHPKYGHRDFLPWLSNYVQVENISVVVPSEAFLHAITSIYDQISPLIPNAMPLAVWSRCMSKVATQAILEAAPQTRVHLPPGGVVKSGEPLPNALQLAGKSPPYFVKGDAGLGVGHTQAFVARCDSYDELVSCFQKQRERYRQLLWQVGVQGEKVCVSLWRHHGEIKAQSMALALHTYPHRAGTTCLRRTFWNEALLADAKLKCQSLEWEGVAYMEYLWHETTGDFWFVEINARYWAYLHLDLYAGKDFPRMQVDAVLGVVATDLAPPKREVVCRSAIPHEFSYLVSVLRDPELAKTRKMRSIAGFFLRFLDPFSKADLLYGGDRRLYWLALKAFVADLVRWRKPTRL